MPRAIRYAVVMAGGAGTRFWPRSRSHLPKQFLPITGRASMLQDTVARVSPPVRADRVFVVTGQMHAALAKRQLAGFRGVRLLVVEATLSSSFAFSLALTVHHGLRRPKTEEELERQTREYMARLAEEQARRSCLRMCCSVGHCRDSFSSSNVPRGIAGAPTVRGPR